jgi:hypothetical protein
VTAHLDYIPSLMTGQTAKPAAPLATVHERSVSGNCSEGIAKSEASIIYNKAISQQIVRAPRLPRAIDQVCGL